MVGPSFIDEIDCGNFFDHIDDLLDFPEDINSSSNENGFVGGENIGDFQSLWTEPPELFPGSESVFLGNKSSCTSDLSAELSVPYEDIVQLEWLSNFVEDSFSGGDGMTMDEENSSINKLALSSDQLFQSTSPISVLESSSSCSVATKTLALSPEIGLAPTCCGRARSKRPRPPMFTPRPPIQLMPFHSSLPETPKVVSKSESNASSPLTMIPNPEHKKKKKIKMEMPNRAVETVHNQDENHNENTPPAQAAVRKCLHCEITKTPQWRAGPMGPKTLCNACGVRYKSGRLYPEYRPAASPTFVASLHSNSHKKVLEMRNKADDNNPVSVSGKTAIASSQPELIPNNSHLMDYM